MINKNDLKIGLYFTHRYNNRQYQIINLILSEHPNTTDWYEAVYYIDTITKKGFCRSIDHFCKSFKEL